MATQTGTGRLSTRQEVEGAMLLGFLDALDCNLGAGGEMGFVYPAGDGAKPEPDTKQDAALRAALAGALAAGPLVVYPSPRDRSIPTLCRAIWTVLDRAHDVLALLRKRDDVVATSVEAAVEGARDAAKGYPLWDCSDCGESYDPAEFLKLDPLEPSEHDANDAHMHDVRACPSCWAKGAKSGLVYLPLPYPQGRTRPWHRVFRDLAEEARGFELAKRRRRVALLLDRSDDPWRERATKRVVVPAGLRVPPPSEGQPRVLFDPVDGGPRRSLSLRAFLARFEHAPGTLRVVTVLEPGEDPELAAVLRVEASEVVLALRGGHRARHDRVSGFRIHRAPLTWGPRRATPGSGLLRLVASRWLPGWHYAPVLRVRGGFVLLAGSQRVDPWHLPRAMGGAVRHEPVQLSFARSVGQ